MVHSGLLKYLSTPHRSAAASCHRRALKKDYPTLTGKSLLLPQALTNDVAEVLDVVLDDVGQNHHGKQVVVPDAPHDVLVVELVLSRDVAALDDGLARRR